MSYGGVHGKFAKSEGREKDKYQDDTRPIMVKVAEIIEGVKPLEDFCEWKQNKPSSARYTTDCGETVFSSGQEEGDECCCCDRPIKFGK